MHFFSNQYALLVRHQFVQKVIHFRYCLAQMNSMWWSLGGFFLSRLESFRPKSRAVFSTWIINGNFEFSFLFVDVVQKTNNKKEQNNQCVFLCWFVWKCQKLKAQLFTWAISLNDFRHNVVRLAMRNSFLWIIKMTLER